ncbi:MAG: proline--tRNA ligase [Firmicutes bacterium]|nr:proline--tRNA ligase [Bacillota bacterium]
MKLKENFFVTIRENSKDEETISGNLLVRSGMVKKAGSGIYYFLPLGLRVIKKIENIVREEMNNANAAELVMPSLLPEDVYIKSGRRENFGNDMFSLKDRYGRNYVLGPTHEEMFVEVAKDHIKSYKDMPINLYQIANKYRDEPRPRYGLIRVREFIMKDAYSFDRDLDGLHISYMKMFDAYKKIFDRMGIDYKIVTASTGVMGGLLSEEFQAVTEIGEDILVLCDKCDLSSNIEITECVDQKIVDDEQELELELIHTPNVKTIDDLVNNYGIPTSKMAKTLIYKIDGKFYAVMVKSHREVNEYKLLKLLNAKEIELADYADVERITKAQVGFAGPVGIEIPVIIDNEVEGMKNFLVGANKTDYHYKNVNLKDFKVYLQADIANVMEGDKCPCCGGNLYFKKGIEIGNTFKLGTKYSESLGLTYLDEENNSHPVVMGCYGIGIGRILAAIIEQNNDENGIILPMNIAPYQVSIVLINDKDEKQVEVANNLYQELTKKGIEVILDNRNERPGVKFKDMDLIGIPLRITVGKKIDENKVELKQRKEKESIDIEINNVYEIISKLINEQSM